MEQYEQLAQRLEASEDYRVIRRYVQPPFYHAPDGQPKRIGLVVDTETTGLDETDKIIECGAVQFEYGLHDGRIHRILEVCNWLNDPGIPIKQEITDLTGIKQEDVIGQRIDEEKLASLVAGSNLIIAHNAGFDRPILERECPQVGFDRKPWACSHSDIDWGVEGIRSTKLEYLAFRMGFFNEGHRASADCLSTLHILSQSLPVSGRNAMEAMLEKARQPTLRVWAKNLPFHHKDAVKKRDYHWSSGERGRPKSWWKDVSAEKQEEELSFLRTVMGPLKRIPVAQISAMDRHSERAYRLPQLPKPGLEVALDEVVDRRAASFTP